MKPEISFFRFAGNCFDASKHTEQTPTRRAFRMTTLSLARQQVGH